jgi:hypothetical protein
VPPYIVIDSSITTVSQSILLGVDNPRRSVNHQAVVRSFGNFPEVIDSVCLARLVSEKSPSQTTGVLRVGDTGKLIDSEWLTQTAFAAISVSADLHMAAKGVPESEVGVAPSRQVTANAGDIVRCAPPLVSGFWLASIRFSAAMICSSLYLLFFIPKAPSLLKFSGASQL